MVVTEVIIIELAIRYGHMRVGFIRLIAVR